MTTRCQLRSRRLVAVHIIAAWGAFGVRTANAQCLMRSPVGCSDNLVDLSFRVQTDIVPNGGLETFEIAVQNNPATLSSACDAANVFVTFCCPGPDGNPVPGPDGCTRIPVQSVPCVVNDQAGCTPTAEALAGLTLAAIPPDPTHNPIDQSGLVCRIRTNPGVTTARAAAQIEDGYLLCSLDGGEVQDGRKKILETSVGCAGDCNSDGMVTIDELLLLVRIAVGEPTDAACMRGDVNGDGAITIDEILLAVRNALDGCATPTPNPGVTPTVTPTSTISPTATPTLPITPTPVPLIAGCGADYLEMILLKAVNLVPNGTTVPYEVDWQNNPSNHSDGCNVRDVRITFCCPGPDGNPLLGPDGCTRIPVESAPCVVNDQPGCTPTAEALAGLTLAAAPISDPTHQLWKQTGLSCRISTNPGITRAQAQARIDDYVLVQNTEAGVLQPGFSQFQSVELLPP